MTTSVDKHLNFLSQDTQQNFLGKNLKIYQTFEKFLRKHLPEKYYPEYKLFYGYLDDWKIVGSLAESLFLYNNNSYKDNYITYIQELNKMLVYTGIDDELPYSTKNFEEMQKTMKNFVIRSTTKVFHPKQLMFEKLETLQIQLRICISMLDKIKIPKELKMDIRMTMIDCFYWRKLVYEEFNQEQLLKIPFCEPLPFTPRHPKRMLPF